MVGERELRDFVEALNARLVGRSDREIAERFGLTKAEAREILQSCANVREHPKGLWSYLGGIEPVYHLEPVSEVRKPAKVGKPKKPTPAAPTAPSPLSQWEK